MQFDVNNLNLGQIKEIAALVHPGTTGTPGTISNNGMIGKYVVVRCRDAGVHAGILESHNGRECVLRDARRLWMWYPAGKNKWLGAVAMDGLDSKSKLGPAVDRIHLTENCEIIQCTDKAATSIKYFPNDEQ